MSRILNGGFRPQFGDTLKTSKGLRVARGELSSHPMKTNLTLSIRLERDDEIPAFAGFLRCEKQHEGSHVILLNVAATMSPELTDEHGKPVAMPRHERKRMLIEHLMHEFGHALEAHFKLPVNEEAIEAACQSWESAYGKGQS